MDILVVCHYGLYKNLSYSFVHNQVRAYVALGHRVRVLIPNGIGKKGRDGKNIGKSLVISKADGVELYDLRYLTFSRYGEKQFNSRSAIASVKLHWNCLLGDFHPDIIHAHTLGFDSEVGAWLKKKLGCPLVVTTHGSDLLIPYLAGSREWLRSVADRADTVVSVSSQLQKTLLDCGITSSVQVILNGFVLHERECMQQRTLHSIIQVGSLIERKKTDVTIRAVAQLRARYSQISLTIIGQGPQREALEQLCRDLGVSDCVYFTGGMPNDRVQAHMAQSQIFVMPSVREGFGIVYLEAMVAGCVAIGTEGEGIADLIRSGENGYLVPPDDVEAVAQMVARCFDNPDEAERIARSGKTDAQGLTWEENAKKYLELFEVLRQ